MSFSDDGASKLVRFLKSLEEGDFFILFMSDNLFTAENVGGKVVWGSFDVSKMEGSHDERDIEQIIDETFSPYDTSEDIRQQAMINAMKLITRVSSVNGPAILGQEVFKVPYLSSGCVGTADYNCYKMAKAVAILYRYATDLPFDDPRIEKIYQLHFGKLNQLTPLHTGLNEKGILLPIMLFFGMTLEPVVINTDSLKTLADEHYLETDLLGFGIYRPELKSEHGAFDDFYVPVLSRPTNTRTYQVHDTSDRMGKMMIT